VARGQALAGDTAAARKAYESFFEAWKDADPDVPILIQARKEYVGLNQDRSRLTLALYRK